MTHKHMNPAFPLSHVFRANFVTDVASEYFNIISTLLL